MVRHLRFPFIVAVVFSSFIACTREQKTSTALSIQLPASSQQSVSAPPTLSANGWGLSSASAVSDISCYMLMIEASDLATTSKCSDASGNVVALPGFVAGTAVANGTLKAQVPSGSARAITLLGLKATSASACVDYQASAFVRSNYARPMVLAKTTVDLTPGDVSLAMTAVVTGAKEIQSCEGPLFTSEWKPLGGTVSASDVSLINSTLSATPASVSIGQSSNLVFTARDAANQTIIVPGLILSANLTGGTSNGTIGSWNDNGDGTYSAAFLGVGAGTTQSIALTVNSNPLLSTAPTITVAPGALSLSNSDFHSNMTTIVPGFPAQISLQLRDSAGNNLNLPGKSVVFHSSVGGNFGTVVDQGNGLYVKITELGNGKSNFATVFIQ